MGANRVKITRTPMSFTPLAAVQERYKFPGFLCVSIASLHGVAVRPLPCNYNVLQLVYFHGGNTGSNPVGDANLLNGLEEIVLLPVGTKRHKSHPNCAGASPESPMFSRVSSLFLQAQKGTTRDGAFNRRFRLRESDGLHHFAPCAYEV